MPGKSRRGRAKYSARHKKRRGTVTGVAQQQVSAGKPAPSVAVSPPGVPGPVVTVAPAGYSYVTAELTRIGILAGVILVILVVLAVVLR